MPLKIHIGRLLVLAMVSCSWTTAKAQLEHGGEPWGGKVEPDRSEIPFIELPKVDEAQLLKEDSIARSNGRKVLRFAKNIEVNIDIKEEGRTDTVRDGRIVSRIGIYSEDAHSLSFGFRPYRPTPGAELFIYTPDQRRILGSFTHEEQVAGEKLASVPIPGDRAIIELIEKSGTASSLGIQRVSHDYRGIIEEMGQKAERAFGDAGDCNMNVNCPDGRPWRAQKRSIAMIIANGNRACSGALVNNTAEDGTPYLLTADHCLGAGGSPSNWTFLFNYESPDCPDQQGPTDQSLSGAMLRANHEDSDFALLELVDTPPTAYGVFYAGWDHSGSTPDSSVCIHHPNGDIKKIAFDDDQPNSGQFGNSIPNGEWHVQSWDRNTTTEAGSSGSPLFDEKGRTIGQLHGGTAQCGNNIDDYFGKFSVSWDHHAPADSQLKAWLDPIDTNMAQWEGYDPRVGEYPNDAAVTDILSPQKVLCKDPGFRAELEFQNRGSQALDSLKLFLLLEQDTLEKLEWQGSLNPGAYDTVQFGTHSVTSGSSPTMVGGTMEPNGQTDMDGSDDRKEKGLIHRSNGRYLDLKLQTDCYGAESSWTLLNENGDTLYERAAGYYPGTDGSPETGGSEWAHELCLDRGCYELLLRDSYGDGMEGSQYPACDTDGSLEIRDEEGELLASLKDPGFGSDTTLEFCSHRDVTKKEPGERGIKILPNPSSGRFELLFDGAPGEYKLRIHDLRGRLIFRRRIRTQGNFFSGVIDLPNVRAGGIYLLELEGPGDPMREKLFIDR